MGRFFFLILCTTALLSCSQDALDPMTFERAPGGEEPRSEAPADPSGPSETKPQEPAAPLPGTASIPKKSKSPVPRPETPKATEEPGDIDYYVDATLGTDSNDGRSFATAWKTLERVNKATFHPGDRIGFKSGEEFRGRLHVKSSGTSSDPIVFTYYGKGNKPVLQAAGESMETVLIENVSHVLVEGLEISNTAPEPANGLRGVQIRARDAGVMENITLRNLTVRDVNGHLEKDEGAGGGILWECDSNTRKTRIQGLLIEGCHLIRCDRDGIKGGMDPWYDLSFLSTGVVIRNNIIEDGGGDGIVPIGTDGAIVEFNRIYGARQRIETSDPEAMRQAGPSAGIWPWSARNTQIRFNEVWGYQGTLDGQGFDSDWNCDGTLFEFNLSGQNAGGFFLICSFSAQEDIGRSIGNTNTVIRHNISFNDQLRGFVFNGPVRDVKVEGNIVYNMTEEEFKLILDTPWEAGQFAKSVEITGNLFYTTGVAHIYQAVPDDEKWGHWKPEDSINTDTIRLSDNLYTRVISYRNNRYHESGMKAFTTEATLGQLIGNLSDDAESREGFNTLLKFLKESRHWEKIKEVY